MKEYKILNNYLIFNEMNSDSVGTNFRAGTIKKNKTGERKLLTVVHPFLAKKPDVWKRVNILLEGVKKSNIPNLYSPEKIEINESRTLLLYSLIKGKTFEEILEDSTKKNIPINFDLAFSIAIAIADLIDTGSSIVVSGKKSFHGFLTADNIIIDYEGKIFLKNYGIFQYLKPDEEIFSEMERKYGAWLTPEFMRKERLTPQSDVYHMGYIIYRMLTGNYFSLDSDEDFDTKLSSISFSQHIPSSDKDFLTNLITFFKKTLHPDPSKRFANIREFKDFISNRFMIEELSSVTFSLAYFMNSLYSETMALENKSQEEELNYAIPAKKAKDDGKLVEELLTGLDEKENSKTKYIMGSILIAVIAIAVAVFLYINTTKSKKTELENINKAKQEQELQLRNQLAEMEKNYQKKLETIQQQITSTEEEKNAQREKLDKIQKDFQQQKKKETERLRLLEEEGKKKDAEEQDLLDKQKIADQQEKEAAALEEQKKKAETEKKRIEEEKNTAKIGQLIPASEATVKPVKISGKTPGQSYQLKKKYAGRNMAVMASILVNEKGEVEKVKILGNLPNDIKTNIKTTLSQWKYNPAEKDKVKVKVWVQARFSIKYK